MNNRSGKLLAMALVLSLHLAACDSTEEDQTTEDVQGEMATDSTPPCQKQVVAEVTFWDTVCWSGSIVCDGKPVPFSVDGGDVGVNVSICDAGPASCDAPGIMTFTYSFEYTGNSCEYCSDSDDGTKVCVPLANQCTDETVSVTGSGSEEAGPHPMVCCPDDPDCV